jgi:hypothetical protein
VYKGTLKETRIVYAYVSYWRWGSSWSMSWKLAAVGYSIKSDINTRNLKINLQYAVRFPF